MYDFHFSIPTEIYFGKESEMKAGALMAQQVGKGGRVLLIYGSERIFHTGLGDKLVSSLQDAGCTVFKLGGVRPNADAAYIRKAIDVVRKEGIDGILAVGGGSVIDSSKAAAAGTFFDGDIMELYQNPERCPEKFLPVGAVVTLPATASESNAMSVISDDVTGKKIARVFERSKPKFALLNPALTMSVSSFQTASGGFDIFAHAFERYFDLNRKSSLLDRMTLALMKEIVGTLPKTLQNPGDEDLRGELMLAAAVAHNDMLGPGGDFACHEMSHQITETFHVAHGAALAMLIPAWCEYVSHQAPARFAAFYQEVFDVQGERPQDIIEKGISALRRFIDSLELLQTIETTEQLDLAALAVQTLDGRPFIGWGLTGLTAFDIEQIYRKIIRTVA